MSMKEMKTLTIGEDIFEIVDERARGDIETLKDDIPSKPGDVGADPSGTASSEVSSHNTSETSHNDIRLLISGLTTRVNGILDSTDVDLDQLSELVVYIKSNRSLIEQVTTNKVNVADIIDNLTTSVSNKPLSAKQGAVLKGLIDAIKIPSALYEMTEDSTHRVVTDTEKQTWNAKSDFSGSYNDLTNKPTIPTTPQQVGAEPSGTAESKVSEHNTSEVSHNDIRLLIEGLTTRLNTLANSDDTTLDQMSEVVAYIKSNKTLIDAITTNKVNVSDIIDNLTTSASNKPLSAKQGVALKALIDAIKVPTKLSELSDDADHRLVTDEELEYWYEHMNDNNAHVTSGDKTNWNSARSDILNHKADTTVHVTSAEKTNWNKKSNFSGSYNDLTNKPTIPTTPQQVGADPSGTANSTVSAHNTSEASHNDIRLLIEGLSTRLNALANSDDTTLDQMAEVVAYIKNNKSLIDTITTNKVNVTDIIDNLTTSVSNKPLSAKQGVALKALIDAIIVPTKTSQLQNDSNFLTQHQDLSAYAKKATTLSGYGITDGATKEEVNTLSNEIADLTTPLPAHKNTPSKPQTTIVNACQDSTKYKGSGISANTTDNILGSQCVKVTGANAYIRFTTNVFDMKNNHLVVKIKVNSLTEDTCRILIKVGHTTNGSNYAWYTLTKKNSNSVFGEWEEYTVPYLSYSYTTGDATALDFEKINDVFVMLSEGTGDFDIQFVGLRPNTQSKGIVSFTFDDSWKSQYTGIKTLAERGLTGTIFHIEGLPDETTLTTEELQELVKYYGADIEVHGADFYNNMTSEEIVEVWKSTQQYLKENGLSDGRHLAYPGGQYPKQATDIVMKYFDSARTIDRYIYQETFPPFDSYKMRAFSGVMDSNVAKVKQQIDRTVENKYWLILVFHKIESGSGDMYCTPEALGEIADYAIASGARIMNIAEVFETNGGGIGGGVNIDDVINALPIYNGEVE